MRRGAEQDVERHWNRVGVSRKANETTTVGIGRFGHPWRQQLSSIVGLTTSSNVKRPTPLEKVFAGSFEAGEKVNFSHWKSRNKSQKKWWQ